MILVLSVVQAPAFDIPKNHKGCNCYSCFLIPSGVWHGVKILFLFLFFFWRCGLSFLRHVRVLSVAAAYCDFPDTCTLAGCTPKVPLIVIVEWS